VPFPITRIGRWMSVTSPYYELFPVLDHVIPLARGGHRRDPANIVTTSTVRNSAKAGFRLEELGWKLVDDAFVKANGWDGLMGWFYNEVIKDQSLRDDSMIERWHRAGWYFRSRFRRPDLMVTSSNGLIDEMLHGDWSLMGSRNPTLRTENEILATGA
jgi:hypothetical protein